MAALLVVMSGLPGTGKSTIARAVADHLGAAVLSADSIEAAMNRTGINREHGQGSYRAGYEIIGALVVDELRADRPVVADATYFQSGDREALRDTARAHGAPVITIVTTCTDRVLHERRLRGRSRAGLDGFLYAATWESLEPHLDNYETPPEADLVLDAGDPLAQNASRAVAAVSAP